MQSHTITKHRTKSRENDETHNPKVAGSDPAPATKEIEGLAKAVGQRLLIFPVFTRICTDPCVDAGAETGQSCYSTLKWLPPPEQV